jgi:hypothetical protein
MKKIFSIAIAICISYQIQAQINVGFQAGLSVANPSITSLPNASSITYVQPGLVLDYKLGNAFSIRPSINYLQTGYSNTVTLGSIINTYKTTINNLQIPLDLCVPIKAGPGKLILCAGPTLQFSLNGNTVQSSNVSTPVNKTVLKFGSDSLSLKQINWGTNFGLGYQLKNGLELKANYNIGLTDQINNSAVYKNNVLSLMLAYYFIKSKSKK